MVRCADEGDVLICSLVVGVYRKSYSVIFLAAPEVKTQSFIKSICLRFYIGTGLSVSSPQLKQPRIPGVLQSAGFPLQSLPRGKERSFSLLRVEIILIEKDE